jgi:hypothetical protein
VSDRLTQPDDHPSAAALQRWHAPAVQANRLMLAQRWGQAFLAYNVFIQADQPGAAALSEVQDRLIAPEPSLLRMPAGALHTTAAFLLPGSAEFDRPKDELWHQHGTRWLAQLTGLAAATPEFRLCFRRLVVTDVAIIAVADEPNGLSAFRRRLLTAMDVPGNSHSYDLVHMTLFRYSAPLRDPAGLLSRAGGTELRADFDVRELIVAREHTFPFLGYDVLRRLPLPAVSLAS